MAKMTFNEYLSDCLGLHVGLMSQADIADAKKGFEAFLAPKKRQPAHPDSKLSSEELRARCERLTASQKITVERYSATENLDQAVLDALKNAVAVGEALLSAKRAGKAKFIEHAELNSAASRQFNLATRK